jgi:hypothetical protein
MVVVVDPRDFLIVVCVAAPGSLGAEVEFVASDADGDVPLPGLPANVVVVASEATVVVVPEAATVFVVVVCATVVVVLVVVVVELGSFRVTRAASTVSAGPVFPAVSVTTPAATRLMRVPTAEHVATTLY